MKVGDLVKTPTVSDLCEENNTYEWEDRVGLITGFKKEYPGNQKWFLVTIDGEQFTFHPEVLELIKRK
tara:strand:+ start:97 stop:300 length:204 start_codon:yes stop_codon:yes gene_type:complete